MVIFAYGGQQGLSIQNCRLLAGCLGDHMVIFAYGGRLPVPVKLSKVADVEFLFFWCEGPTAHVPLHSYTLKLPLLNNIRVQLSKTKVQERYRYRWST
jgi:hypothetical protein